MRLRSFFTNSAGIMTSRVFGFLRDLLMASILGANIYSDILFVAFKLPNLFRRIFAEGAFTQSFLPNYVRSDHPDLFAVALFKRFLLLLLALSLAVTLFSPWVTKAVAMGFDAKTVALASPLVAINFYYLDLIFVVAFLAALLQNKEHYAVTAFGTSLLNIAMITALLLFRHEEPLKIVHALSWAVLAGGTAQVALHIWMARRLGIWQSLIAAFGKLRSQQEKIQTELRTFHGAFLPAVLGNSTAQLAAFVDTWLASFLNSGAISHLFYANRLFQLPLALFATAAATALFPSVTRALKAGRVQEAVTASRRAFALLLGLLGGATAVTLVLHTEIVKLLFERGAFGTADTKETALILLGYIAGLLPFGLAKLFSLWLYADNRQKEAAMIASKSLGVNIALSLLLIAPLAAPGLALASSLGGWVLFWLTLKAVGGERVLDIMRSKYIPHALGFTLFSALTAWGIKAALHGYL